SRDGDAGQDAEAGQVGPGLADVGRAGEPRSGAPPRADASPSSAAELRELAELADLLAEFAGLVRDLGALIVGLMKAATGAGERQVRTFTIPADLAELAG